MIDTQESADDAVHAHVAVVAITTEPVAALDATLALVGAIVYAHGVGVGVGVGVGAGDGDGSGAGGVGVGVGGAGVGAGAAS